MSAQDILLMRRVLGEPLPWPVWPVGSVLAAFDPIRHAVEVHALLTDAYADGGGAVDSFEIWWGRLSTDPEFDANLCFLALAEDGDVAGVAQCWTSAFVKDLAVRRDWRGRGLATALLMEAFHAFRRRGATVVELKVLASNVPALALYERLGMRAVNASS